MRASLVAACILLSAVAVAPGAAASHVKGPCDVVHWDPGEPTGWDSYCLVDRAVMQVVHNVLVTAECMADFDPRAHGHDYLVDCTDAL